MWWTLENSCAGHPIRVGRATNRRLGFRMLNTHQPNAPSAAADPRGIPNLTPANPYAAVPVGERIPTRPHHTPTLPPLSENPARLTRVTRPAPALSPTNSPGHGTPIGAVPPPSRNPETGPSLAAPVGEGAVSEGGMTAILSPPPARRAVGAHRRYEPVGFPGATRGGKIHPWIPGVSTPEGIILRPAHSAMLSYQREQALENARSTASLLALSLFVTVPATCAYLVGRL